MARFSLAGGLDRTWVTGPGLVLRGFADAAGDLYTFDDDPVLGDADEARLRSTAGLEMRFPMVQRTPQVTRIVEPIIQIAHGAQTGDVNDIPNEDSLLVEFDETSLFSTNRFPGTDRYETGTYANVGLRY